MSWITVTWSMNAAACLTNHNRRHTSRGLVFRERFHKGFGVRRDDFQIHERHVQLFQLFLGRLIRRADEMVRRSNAASPCWTGN
jgi:hypothetical protein